MRVLKEREEGLFFFEEVCVRQRHWKEREKVEGRGGYQIAKETEKALPPGQ